MMMPSDVAQEALDAALLNITVSEITDGTREAQLLARKYRPCLAALLRSARWAFARRQIAMTILGDATGQLTSSTVVIPPWCYEYSLPNDCVQAHYVPFAPPIGLPGPSGNTTTNTYNNTSSSTSITTSAAISTAMAGMNFKPARFLISRDVNYPPAEGQQFWEVQGVSPMGQTVVLTNVPNAQLVYTSLVLTPSEWATDFREAMVAYLAAEICVLHRDIKVAMAVRREQVAIAKEKIMLARVSDGNESWSSTDHQPDWLRARQGGRGLYGWDAASSDAGSLYIGYGPIPFGDNGSAY